MAVLQLIFHPYVIAIYACILSVLIFYLFLQYDEKKKLKDSLGFALYEVILPRFKKEEGKNLKDKIAPMEQFYAGMAAINSHFAMEIVSPATQNEVNFYVAVPKEKTAIFENQVHSIFPEAEVREETADYNIFKLNKPAIGASFLLKESWILPVKTYEGLVSDPLETILNALSGLNREKEGASFQIIVGKPQKNFKHNLEKSIKLLLTGASIKTALKGGESFVGSLLKILTGGTIQDGGVNNSEAPFSGKELKQEIIELLKKKNASVLFPVNMRMTISAETPERAEKILSDLSSAFLQFNNPQGNALEMRRLDGRALKKMFFNFSFRLFDKKNVLPLNTAELASIFHFPSLELFAPKVGFLKYKKAEPPINLPREGTSIGKNNFRDRETEVRIAVNDRRRHCYIIGQTGTGKSVLMETMIMQDINSGKGVCFIDPHGDLAEKILGNIPEGRWEDIIYFNPAETSRPMGLNMLEYDKNYPEQKTFIVNELLEIFNKLYDMTTAGGPMFEQYFRNAALLVMEHPESGNTLLEISRVLADKGFRHFKLSKTENPVVKSFWLEAAEKAGGEAALQNMVPYITSKFDTFLANEIMRPIIAQEKSSLNFREIMDKKKILLINLSKGRLGDLNADLLGMILIGKIFMAAMSRVDVPESTREDFYLYIDEFQNITTKTIANILSEARKYRLNLTITHQFIGQLEEEIKKAVFGNIGSLISFRVGEEDAEFLAKYFAPVFTTENLINLPNFNACVKLLINGEVTRPFNISTDPPLEEKNTIAKKVKELSAIKYGRPRSEIESEVSKKYLKSLA